MYGSNCRFFDSKTNSGNRKRVELSFAVLKAPERKIIDLSPVSRKSRKKLNENGKESGKVPAKFVKLAKKFGLEMDHLEFFYQNRDSFHWETKEKKDTHCNENGCNFTIKESKGCLVDHMITVHNYEDIPCGKPDCSFIGYSEKTLNLHRATFHGHGKRPDEKAVYPCPYSSCKSSFRHPSILRRHVDTHENRVYSCSYCQYRNSAKCRLAEHLNIHFDIKKFVCDICTRPFYNNNDLTHHKSRSHKAEGADFECIDCGFSAPAYKSFKVHRSTCKERLKHSRIL